MPLKKEEFGTGITKRWRRAVTSSSGPEEHAEMRRRLPIPGSFEDRYGGPVEQGCRDLLAKHGILDEHEVIMVKAEPGEWTTFESITKRHGFEDDSPEGFAAQILDKLHLVRIFINNQSIETLALLACDYGRLIESSRIKFQYEAAIDHGLKFGPKPKRTDPLGRAIDDALRQLGKEASTQQVLARIDDHDDSPILEIDPDTEDIVWLRKNGRSAKTTRRSFENRVSVARGRIFRH